MSTDQNLQQTVDRFLAHKRAHGRKYHSEESELRLLVAFATEHHAGRLSDLTPALLEQFLGSRARSRPKSFNHLRNAVGCLMDWAVSQELIAVSPLRTRRRRVTSNRIPFLFDPGPGQATARRRRRTARQPQGRAARDDLPHDVRAVLRARLRAGEVCGLRLGDLDTTRALLVVRGGKFGKTRLVPHGPRIAGLLAAQLQRRREDDAAKMTRPGTRSRPSRSSPRDRCIPAPPARCSTGS
jgi:integrase